MTKRTNIHFFHFLRFFALLSILFIPFPFALFPYQSTISEGLFGGVIHFILGHTSSGDYYHPAIVSDSLMLYILLVILFFLAIVFTTIVKKFIKKNASFNQVLQSIFSYYLALILVKYGADKLFLSQFYIPEPNILYTPLGYLDKDILFWSTMGTSFGYNAFMGLAQIVTAILLLFHKTRVLGAIFASAIFINIVAINFSFDISVKLYSCFLLFLALLTLSPFFKQLYAFLIQRKPSNIASNRPLNIFYSTSITRTFIKTFIILLIIVEAIYPNLQIQPLPYLHGAYQVINNKEQDPPFKRLFIHKDNYLIFQDHDDNMSDYRLDIDSINNRLILTDYFLTKDTLTYQYSKKDSSLMLLYHKNKKWGEIVMRQLKHDDLPVMKHRFHWIIDGE